MHTVFLMTDKKNKTYYQITSILKKYGFSIIDSIEIYMSKKHRQAIRINFDSNIHADNAIILLLECNSHFNPTIYGKITAICESSNSNALNILKSVNVSAILCGMSKTDSITFSSITGDKALISVQRPIKKINGKILDPCEILVTLKHKYSNSAVICACALLILSDINITEL